MWTERIRSPRTSAYAGVPSKSFNFVRRIEKAGQDYINGTSERPLEVRRARQDDCTWMYASHAFPVSTRLIDGPSARERASLCCISPGQSNLVSLDGIVISPDPKHALNLDEVHINVYTIT